MSERARRGRTLRNVVIDCRLARAATQPAEAIPAEALRQLFARDYSRLFDALEAQRQQGSD